MAHGTWRSRHSISGIYGSAALPRPPQRARVDPQAARFGPCVRAARGRARPRRSHANGQGPRAPGSAATGQGPRPWLSASPADPDPAGPLRRRGRRAGRPRASNRRPRSFPASLNRTVVLPAAPRPSYRSAHCASSIGSSAHRATSPAPPRDRTTRFSSPRPPTRATNDAARNGPRAPTWPQRTGGGPTDVIDRAAASAGRPRDRRPALRRPALRLAQPAPGRRGPAANASARLSAARKGRPSTRRAVAVPSSSFIAPGLCRASPMRRSDLLTPAMLAHIPGPPELAIVASRRDRQRCASLISSACSGSMRPCG